MQTDPEAKRLYSDIRATSKRLRELQRSAARRRIDTTPHLDVIRQAAESIERKLAT